MIESGPSQRRAFLDWGVFHVKHSFLEEWRRYQRALRREVAALGLTKDDPPWNAEEELLSSQATRSNGHAGHDTH